MKVQMTPVIKLPFSVIHNVMIYQGFRKIKFNKHSAYRARFDDASSKRSYRLMIPLRDDDNFTCSLNVADAFFEDPDFIPSEVAEAAKCKLREVNDYLQDEREKQNRKNMEEIEQDGGMSPNMKEMIRLGKEMTAMKTNQQLLEAGQIPDPLQ